MPKQRVTLTLDASLVKEIDQFIDGHEIRSRSEAIESFLREYLAERKSAVILAGGDPESLWIPEMKVYRPLVSIGARTLIEDIVLKIRAAGFENIYVVGTNPIITEIYSVLRNGKEFHVNLEYIEEREVLGTAKSLQMIQNKVRSDFLMVPADTYFDFNLSALQSFHLKQKNSATFAIYSRTTFDSKYKGVVEMNGSRITKHTERPEKPTTHLIKTMIGIINPEVFEYIPAGNVHYTLENHVIPELVRDRKCFGYLVSGDWFNLHGIDDLNQLHQFLKEKNRETSI